MLVLTRKYGEKIRIGQDITLVVLEVKGTRVRLGFEAPQRVSIVRGELARLTGAAEAGAATEAHELAHALDQA